MNFGTMFHKNLTKMKKRKKKKVKYSVKCRKYTEPVSQEGLNYRDAVSMVILT